jgi:hypothetical protein
MSRIELPIETTYLPKWGVWEGIRENIQNAKDAEKEHSAPMTIVHEDNILKIFNKGVSLSHEALLFGHSTKTDKRDMIGQWGEGLKLGTLALIRAGHTVFIRSGDETWVPTIEKSHNFDANVLVFNIEKSNDIGGVLVEIHDISIDKWASMRPKFIFLLENRGEFIDTHKGTLILDPDLQGRIYVKGIFIQHKSELLYGYDLKEGEVDRDRRIIEPWDCKWRIVDIWIAAIEDRPELFGHFYTVLQDNIEDIKGIHNSYIQQLSDSFINYAIERFKSTYGEKAVPVHTMSESKDVSFLGLHGIITNEIFMNVILTKEGGLKGIVQKVGKSESKEYGWHELNGIEQNNLIEALEIISWGGVTIPLESIKIVDFISKNVIGEYRKGIIVIAKKIISKRDMVLSTIIHEYAHTAGGDGYVSHILLMEKTWSNIVSALRR